MPHPSFFGIPRSCHSRDFPPRAPTPVTNPFPKNTNEWGSRLRDNAGVHKDQIPILAIVTGGLEKIHLPPLIRPAIPNDNPNEALVRWGTLYYCVTAHLRVVLRGMVELLKLGNVPTAFLACRHVFEWTAHTCLMSRELEEFMTEQAWRGARELQSRVMEGNRWVREHGEKYEPGAAYDQIPDSLRV